MEKRPTKICRNSFVISVCENLDWFSRNIILWSFMKFDSVESYLHLSTYSRFCCNLMTPAVGDGLGGPDSIPGQSMRDFWWTKWNWDRFFSLYFAFPVCIIPPMLRVKPFIYYIRYIIVAAEPSWNILLPPPPSRLLSHTHTHPHGNGENTFQTLHILIFY